MAAREPSEMWSQLLTPEALADNGDLDVSAPSDPFAPKGTWTQCWRLYSLRRTTNESTHQGHIQMSRKVQGSQVRLHIRQANIEDPQEAVGDTTAEVVCLDDELLSPRSWTLTRVMRSGDSGSDIEGTRMTKRMAASDGRLRVACNGRTAEYALPEGRPLTSNWGLLNALSLIEQNESQAFTMLDELDKIKADHRLYRAEDRSIRFGGRHRAVRVYHQIGRACLPWDYYVDAETHRLLLAISGLRACILDSDAAEKTNARYPGF